MLGSLVSSFAGRADGFKGKMILYIIAGIVILVIVSALLDGIKKYIRGLDTAALGAILIWLGYESNKLALVKSLSDLLYLVGGTLVVAGLLLFIIIKIIRGKRRARNKYKAKHQEIENSKPEPKLEEEKNAE